MHLDTSADRLAAILVEFSKKAGGSAIDAWTWALKARSRMHLLVRLVELNDLYELTVAEVESLPEDEDPEFLLLSLKPLAKIFDYFPSVGSHQGVHFAQFIPATAIQGLRHCSLALKRNGVRSATISKTNLDALLSDVREWVLTVAKDPDLTEADKKFIIGRLRDVEDALLGFHIGGYTASENLW